MSGATFDPCVGGAPRSRTLETRREVELGEIFGVKIAIGFSPTHRESYRSPGRTAIFLPTPPKILFSTPPSSKKEFWTPESDIFPR